MKQALVDKDEERASSKYRPEDFQKFTFFRTKHRVLFCAWGGNGKSYLHALRLDTPRRGSMIGIGNTLEKGLWWKGDETGGVPKFCWGIKEGGTIHVFIGRLAFLFETKKVEHPPHLEIR